MTKVRENYVRPLDLKQGLVEAGVGQLHEMERIRDLDRVGEHRRERGASDLKGKSA